jgi:phosphoglycerate dehydrogenase-like enzyme
MAGDAAVRYGGFEQARRTTCLCELSELTLGIVGLGRIGKAVARRCRHGFGMRILYNDIVSPGWLDFAATPVGKEELYNTSDVVSLHVPLTDETKYLINAGALAKFKPQAILLNTSRGAVVDSEALAHALSSGAIAGAALDVFDPEPLPPNHALMHAPNTLFSPHVGARTVGGLARMNEVVEDVIRVLEGKQPLYPAEP